MKIAQVAPLIESVPPELYGGTERIVSYVTEQLVDQGHDVTLFATADSTTSGELVACCDGALRSDPNVHDPVPHHMLMLEHVRQRAREFDIIHFHLDHLHLPLCRMLPARTVTTLHCSLDRTDVASLYDEFDDVPLVSISTPQRNPVPDARWVGTVHHGLPHDLYEFSRDSQGYLAFLGRLSPEKRPDRAIEIAAGAGLPLKIAAKINGFEQGYVDRLELLLEQPHVEFMGEIADDAKGRFLGGAKALLFPIDWPEPFGIAMIEAMACGTPVIAWRSGAVPDVVEHGVTGFIVDSIREAVTAIGRLDQLNRTTIRRCFEDRFTVERMARDYLRIYRKLAGRAQLQVVTAQTDPRN